MERGQCTFDSDMREVGRVVSEAEKSVQAQGEEGITPVQQGTLPGRHRECKPREESTQAQGQESCASIKRGAMPSRLQECNPRKESSQAEGEEGACLATKRRRQSSGFPATNPRE